MWRVLLLSGIGVVISLVACSPDSSSPDLPATVDQPGPPASKTPAVPASSQLPTLDRTESVAPASPAAASESAPQAAPIALLPESLSVVQKQAAEPAVAENSAATARWPTPPTTTLLEEQPGRYMAALERYRLALEKRRESVEKARTDGVMAVEEYAPLIERYRQGIRAYRLGYARYKQRQVEQ